MAEPLQNGTRRTIDGKLSIYCDGYWIRYYVPPTNTLAAKKRLIDHLTRRTFHHTEDGINTPGEKLEFARTAYQRESDPARKRVNAAMLAGALFNRATDIFTVLVRLAENGVSISPDNELLKQCGDCFREALELGRHVKHYSGHEGIDELWGEPFKAFTMSIDDFYESRYIKIAQTMRDIDRIANTLRGQFADDPAFNGLHKLLKTYALAARAESETMKVDPSIFEVWPRFVAAGEALLAFEPQRPNDGDEQLDRWLDKAVALIREGRELIGYLAGARVPMPKSTREFLEHCAAFPRSPRATPLQMAETTTHARTAR
jgi:hypothetical protein